MRNRTNTEMLHKVVTTLGDSSREVIFVGGSVVGLYATDEGAAPVRPTFDVDWRVHVVSSTIEEDIASALRPSEIGRRRVVLGRMEQLANQGT